MALAVSQAELKVFLDELLESDNADTYKAFGLDGALPDGQMPSAVVDDAIESRLQSFKDERLKGINAKDEAFNAYRRRESIKKGAKVAAFSLVAGTVIQEVHATFSSDRTGLAEQAWGGNDNPGAHETWLGSALPDQGGTVEHKDFYHTPQMIADLEANGHEVIENHTTTYTTVTEKITAAEYAQSHPGEMRHFKDVRLFTNNTERIDLNELGGQLGKGPEGTVRVWDTMTKNGSIDGGDSLNMINRSNNVFTIALKQPDGTHIHKIFEYGQDVGKPWADMMYQKQDGTWGFKGDGYIAWGQSADETLNVAASIKGDGGPNTFDISNSIPEVKYDYEIRTPSMDQPTIMPGAVWAPGGSRLGAATRPAGKPAAVTSQELVPLEPNPVGTESDRLPVPAQQNAEPDVIRESTPEQPFNEIETNQRKVAREAGWPLLELDISPNQNVSIEQWKVAAEFVQRSNELRPNITDPMGQLRAAIELAEQEGLDGETRGLLYGLYQINQADNKESGSPESETSRSEEQSSSSSDSRSGSSTQQQAQPQTAKTSVDDGNSSESIPRQSTETQLPPVNPEVTARMEEVNVLLDEVRNLRDPYNRDKYAMASKAQITPELFEKARGIYMNVVRERGSELSTKLVLRYAAAAVHPDRGGDEDTLELYQAITWINEQLRGK
jgi:hypothetical protein